MFMNTLRLMPERKHSQNKGRSCVRGKEKDGGSTRPHTMSLLARSQTQGNQRYQEEGEKRDERRGHRRWMSREEGVRRVIEWD